MRLEAPSVLVHTSTLLTAHTLQTLGWPWLVMYYLSFSSKKDPILKGPHFKGN